MANSARRQSDVPKELIPGRENLAVAAAHNEVGARDRPKHLRILLMSKSKSVCPLVPGRAYSFQYPRHNFSGVLSKLEIRRIKVESIRDLRDEPLERITFEIQPLLQRGRMLVTGIDLDKGQFLWGFFGIDTG